MNVYKKEGRIVVSINETDHIIIDENGQMQLKSIYRFLIDCHSYGVTSEEQITFEGIDDDLKNGLSIFLKDLLSKPFADDGSTMTIN